MRFRGKRVLVTGGLGFIGSNLVIQLVKEGAAVTVVDNLLPGCGGNLYNVRPVHDDLLDRPRRHRRPTPEGG